MSALGRSAMARLASASGSCRRHARAGRPSAHRDRPQRRWTSRLGPSPLRWRRRRSGRDGRQYERRRHQWGWTWGPSGQGRGWPARAAAASMSAVASRESRACLLTASDTLQLDPTMEAANRNGRRALKQPGDEGTWLFSALRAVSNCGPGPAGADSLRVSPPRNACQRQRPGTGARRGRLAGRPSGEPTDAGTPPRLTRLRGVRTIKVAVIGASGRMGRRCAGRWRPTPMGSWPGSASATSSATSAGPTWSWSSPCRTPRRPTWRTASSTACTSWSAPPAGTTRGWTRCAASCAEHARRSASSSRPTSPSVRS